MKKINLKLTFNNGEREIVHYTNEYRIKDGTVCFYLNGNKEIENYLCIAEKFLVNVEKVSA
jgi:hypothetical protein